MWQRQVSALRPLGVGERIDVAIKIVRRNFLAFAKAALVISIPSAIVVALIVVSMISSLRSVFNTTTDTNGLIVPSPSGDLTTFFGGIFALEIFSFLVITLVTAVAFRIVGNAYLGQPAGWREAIGVGLKRLHSLVWVQLLIGLVVVIVELAFALASVALSAAHLGGFNALLVLGFLAGVAWYFVATSLAIPTVMLENIRGTKAIGRSIALCRKYWWTTFGTLFLAALLSYIAFFALSLVMFFLARLVGTAIVVTSIAFGLVALLGYLIVLSFIAAILVVITIDLRVRKEGFDIEHLASQMGTTPTSSALSFMPATHGPPAWGYGAPGGPGGPGSGGWGPPPPGWPPVGQPPQQPWGQPPQQPWGQPPGPPRGAPPGWPQPSPGPQQPWGQQPQPPWSQPRPGRTPPGPPPDAPQTSAGGVPFRPLPPFRPRGAQPGEAPPAAGAPKPPSQEPPPVPEPDS